MNESLKKTLYAGLQYRLKCELHNPEYYDTIIGELYRLETCNDSEGELTCVVGEYEDEYMYAKPILFSLDQLTKPITIGGETFVPIDALIQSLGYGDNYKSQIKWRVVDCIKPGHVGFNKGKTLVYIVAEGVDKEFEIIIRNGELCNRTQNWIVEKLHEWHFNVFKLKKGECIPAEEGGYY